MYDYKCVNAQHIKEGLTLKIICKATDGICHFVRYCPTKKQLEHSEGARTCKLNPDNENK
mgnify:CR=1 FL=1